MTAVFMIDGPSWEIFVFREYNLISCVSDQCRDVCGSRELARLRDSCMMKLRKFS